tara:strand:+ start:1335 stop:1589 length:255 start_codon:yes stop_codon:yes gene_type:complete
MGKVKEKPLPTPDTNPVDGDKLIEETKPKKVKKTEEKPKKVKEEIDIKQLKKDLDKIGSWVADVDDDLKQLEDLVDRIAKRMGL